MVAVSKKDILNLVYIARYYGLTEVADYWHGVVKINDYQIQRFTKRIESDLGDINNKFLSILGWSFKKQTNDSRESPSIYVSRELVEKGAYLKIYDPMVTNDKIIKDIEESLIKTGLNKNKVINLLERITIVDSMNEAIDKSTGIVIITNWDEFVNFDWEILLLNKNKAIYF